MQKQTPFQLAQAQAAAGTLKTPSVSMGTDNGVKEINYFGYQLAVHHFNLKIMAKGMSCRGIKLKDLKTYYGLTGRSAADCLPQYEGIMNEYKSRFDQAKATA